MQSPERVKKVRILAHPGAPKDPQSGEPTIQSGVKTSVGDKFHGDLVELPESEVKLLIAMKRAEEYVESKKKTA